MLHHEPAEHKPGGRERLERAGEEALAIDAQGLDSALMICSVWGMDRREVCDRVALETALNWRTIDRYLDGDPAVRRSTVKTIELALRRLKLDVSLFRKARA